MTKEEAAVQFYFHLTVGALMFTLVAGVAAMMVLSHRASKKLTANLDWILALPADQVSVWVHEYVSTASDTGPYTEYTLYAQAKDGESVKLTENHDHAKWACRVLAKNGRPVRGAPAWWLDRL